MDTTLELIVGKTYKITHIKKGTFRALLLGVIPGDKADAQLLWVRYDTRRGSGQEHLARSTAEAHESNLRPSFITKMTLLPDEPWLLTADIKDHQSKEKQQYQRELDIQSTEIAKKIVAQMQATAKKPSFWDNIRNRLKL